MDEDAVLKTVGCKSLGGSIPFLSAGYWQVVKRCNILANTAARLAVADIEIGNEYGLTTMLQHYVLITESRFVGSNPTLLALNMESDPPASNSSNYKPYVIVLDVLLH